MSLFQIFWGTFLLKISKIGWQRYHKNKKGWRLCPEVRSWSDVTHARRTALFS